MSWSNCMILCEKSLKYTWTHMRLGRWYNLVFVGTFHSMGWVLLVSYI